MATQSVSSGQTISVNIEAIPQTTGDFARLKYILFKLVIEIGAKKIVEIGTNVGDSTRVLSKALEYTQGKIVTIDIVPPHENWHEKIKLENCTFITQDSLKIELTDQVDMLFLDGDHHQDHVLTELRKFGPNVRSKGLIVLHDTQHSEFGSGIRTSINQYCKEMGIKDWQNYETDHGLGVIVKP